MQNIHKIIFVGTFIHLVCMATKVKPVICCHPTDKMFTRNMVNS
uniref:Uncharacterized protein n=1 Tax=Rhizophora mucronata TaxID=61149 RepID=A0A2P2NYG4_RHIMU